MKRKEPGQFQGLDSRTSKFISVLMEAEPEPDEPELTLIKNQHTLDFFLPNLALIPGSNPGCLRDKRPLYPLRHCLSDVDQEPVPQGKQPNQENPASN